MDTDNSSHRIPPAAWPSPFEVETDDSAAREYFERSKLEAEARQAWLEIQRSAAKDDLEQRKLKAEAEKLNVEMAKLHGEARTARWGIIIEPAKALLPAIALVLSVLYSVGQWKESQQAHEDSDTVSRLQLLESALTSKDGNDDAATKTVRHMVALLGIGKFNNQAIAILLADFDATTDPTTLAGIRRVLRYLDGRPELRDVISNQVLLAIDEVTRRNLNEDKPFINMHSFNAHLELWRAIHDEHAQFDDALWQHENQNCQRLAVSLVTVVTQKNPDHAQDIIAALNAMSRQEKTDKLRLTPVKGM